MRGIVKNTLLAAVLFIATAIVLGAFGAHALKEVLSEQALNSFETGVRYQFFNGLGLGLLALISDRFPAVKLRTSLILIALGVVLFSGSIYVLAASTAGWSPRSIFGPITPIGGALMIIGWFVAFVQILKVEKSN